MRRCDEIVTFVPGKSFLEVLKKLFRHLAASHRTWNVTKCDENVTSHHIVTVPHSNTGPGSGKIPAWNDPYWGFRVLRPGERGSSTPWGLSFRIYESPSEQKTEG